MYKRKRVDPRMIGIFVIGAIILGVAGLIFFGPGGLGLETKKYVLHFDSSVKGLNVGSPVRFRGVKIGQVKDINVRIRPEDLEFRIPVVIEIEPSRIGADGSTQGILDALKSSVKGGDPVKALVEKGLRAKLELDSLVTGQLYVNFDMLPDSPISLSGYDTEYTELPTVRSSLGELTKTFEELPLRELANKLIHSADGFEKLITSPSLHNGLARFDETMEQLNSLLKNTQEQIVPLLRELRATVGETKTLLTDIDSKVDPISKDVALSRQALVDALEKVTAASEQTRKTMDKWQGLAAQDSPLQQQLSITLQELGRTAQSIRYLTDEIKSDPQILLRGRTDGARQ